jgi:regulator of replication initiation timing
MKNYKVLFLLFFFIVNSCSKEDEINQLNETIVNLQNDIAQLNSQINDYSSQVNQLISQNNILLNQVENGLAQNNALSNQNNILLNQVENGLTQNNALSNQIDDLNNLLNGFQDQIQEYVAQIEVLTESNQILQSDNNSLTTQINNLQDQLYTIQSQSAVDGLYLFNKIEILEPPFSGTMWDLPDLIKSSDYTIYSTSSYQGIETRLFYDKSIPDFINYPAHVYKVNFGDDLSIDFEIYTEFTQQEAGNIEQKYAPLIGQLGKDLRKNIISFEFLKGEEAASAQRTDDLNYANITFHTEWLTSVVETRPEGDKTEELLIHESAHLSIDPYVYGQQEWTDAVNLDGNYLSTYAKDNPNSEDVAETFQAYIAVKYFPDRISNSLRDTILSVCLNRFEYFDSLNLDLSIYK